MLREKDITIRQQRDDVIELHKGVVRIRLIEEAIAKRYQEQKMRCPTHLSIGQEAVPVGISSSLTLADKVYSSHRAHAHYLAKGGSLNKLIAELYGKETGCTGGRGGSMHLCDLDVGFMASTAIVANSIPLAVGHALHIKGIGQKSIAISYFGDGAVEEGAFYEAMNFAVLKSLPILFVCENNFYSVYSPLEMRQPLNRKISDLARVLGANVQEIDGNNVEEVAEATNEAKADLMNGCGPAFFECATYRHREHCGPNFDDNLGYRPDNEVGEWKQRDPFAQAENLLHKHINLEEFKQSIDAEIEMAFNLAEKSNFPPPESISKYIYA